MNTKSGYLFYELLIGVWIGVVIMLVATYALGIIAGRQKMTAERAHALEKAITTFEMICKNPVLIDADSFNTWTDADIKVKKEKHTVAGMEHEHLHYYEVTVSVACHNSTISVHGGVTVVDE
ncbi:MAG TPA: hypothetical protein VEK38_04650 [Candidatus Bathyarchaeia archaeon]|nr:hypothetical protein [Candidatus Bathyarchaeia archaeon]